VRPKAFDLHESEHGSSLDRVRREQRIAAGQGMPDFGHVLKLPGAGIRPLRHPSRPKQNRDFHQTGVRLTVPWSGYIAWARKKVV
jgi:hypothetical protein